MHTATNMCSELGTPIVRLREDNNGYGGFDFNFYSVITQIAVTLLAFGSNIAASYSDRITGERISSFMTRAKRLPFVNEMMLPNDIKEAILPITILSYYIFSSFPLLALASTLPLNVALSRYLIPSIIIRAGSAQENAGRAYTNAISQAQAAATRAITQAEAATTGAITQTQAATTDAITWLRNTPRTYTDSLRANVLNNNRIRPILIVAGLSAIIFSIVTTAFIIKSAVDLTRFMVSKTFQREYTWK